MVTIIEDALYAIHWPNSHLHELDQMAELLTDVEYVTNYFNRFPKGLEYHNISILEAVVRTRKEATQIINELFEVSEASLIGKEPDLDNLFEKLHKPEYYEHHRYYTDCKLKGLEAPWVRIYAIKVDQNVYVITGFGIKLVLKMQDDPLLLDELKKLESASLFLKEIGVLN